VILARNPKLVAGLTKHEAAVGGPDMLIYAILAERKKDLLFILHVYARRNILVIPRFIFVILSTWDRRLGRGRRMPGKDVLECK
jgi:hypothetical protein